MTGDQDARISRVKRETKETEVNIDLNIDGSGTVECDLSDEFLRHMVETLVRYSRADARIMGSGDIDHHLIEDVAITLGRAFREAMGESPVERIANAVVPMDEALVQVTVDLIDRPFVHLDLPDKMYSHFLRSFAMELRATIHTTVLRGSDDHHIVEATFKALGLALHGAMARAEATVSTKSSVKWGFG